MADKSVYRSVVQDENGPKSVQLTVANDSKDDTGDGDVCEDTSLPANVPRGVRFTEVPLEALLILFVWSFITQINLIYFDPSSAMNLILLGGVCVLIVIYLIVIRVPAIKWENLKCCSLNNPCKGRLRCCCKKTDTTEPVKATAAPEGTPAKPALSPIPLVKPQSPPQPAVPESPQPIAAATTVIATQPPSRSSTGQKPPSTKKKRTKKTQVAPAPFAILATSASASRPGISRSTNAGSASDEDRGPAELPYSKSNSYNH